MRNLLITLPGVVFLAFGLPGYIDDAHTWAGWLNTMFGPEWHWWNYTMVFGGLSWIVWVWRKELAGLFQSQSDKPSVAPKTGGEIALLLRVVREAGESRLYTSTFFLNPGRYEFMFWNIEGKNNAYLLRPVYRAILLPFFLIWRLAYTLLLVGAFCLPLAIIALILDALFGFGLIDFLVTL